MLIDLHNHTGWGSGDSHLDPSDLVERARHWGLDGIAITEHNQLWDPEKIEMLRRRHDFTVIGGVEVDTDVGHVLVFGLDGPRRWNRLPTLEELRPDVDEAGGVIVAAHPFRAPVRTTRSEQSGEGFWEEIAGRYRPRLVDAVEVDSGLGDANQRRMAAELARRLDLPSTGGSDTHRLMDVATCFTVFDDEIKDERDLVAAIKARCCRGGDWSSEGLANKRVQELTSAAPGRTRGPREE
jgi:predicted metal-dependent phosphoesterase TrpH